MKTKKITFGAMCLALSILLPQVFHLIGMSQAGSVFLPMHIPVFIGGMLLGPIYGICLGALAPIISFLLTGMPGSDRILFMIAELATYGMVSGLLFHNFKLHEKKMGSLISLIISMAAGRLVYGLTLVFAANLLGMQLGGFNTIFIAITTGIPGIIIQLIFIPVIVSAIFRGGYINDINTIKTDSKRA